MGRRKTGVVWVRALERSAKAMARQATRAVAPMVERSLSKQAGRRLPPPGDGDWLAGVALGAGGARRYRLYRPPDVRPGERLPLLVMLHGCGQDPKAFAQGTRMNRLAGRERFLVLYPEQDRLANAQGCWNWFDTRSGRAYAEADVVMRTVEQVCMLYPVDRERVAVAGLSAGASMAALLVTRYPGRFKAVVMHSGIPPGTAHSALTAVGAMHGHRSAALALAPAGRLPAWPPLLVIHGSEDRVVSVNNGYSAVQAWAGALGARARAARTLQRGARYPATITDYRIRGSTVATLVVVESLGHAWSGGAAREAHTDAKGPDASRMLWGFVARQFERA